MSDKPPLRDCMSYYGVDLNSSRREVLVRCPVHDEDRPSCSVNELDGLWNCHACSAGGDVWTLIMQKEGFDEFREAVQFAETKLGWQSGDRTRTRAAPKRDRGAGFRPAYRKRILSG